jgi:uncharacterized membrane protein HdeD (DUF308 family)
MKKSAMPDAVDDLIFGVGGAILSPGPGTAELVLAALVALAFAVSAVKTWLAGHRDPWRHGQS